MARAGRRREPKLPARQPRRTRRPGVRASSTSLGTLPNRVTSAQTIRAQRFLDAAIDSVRSALKALDIVRDQRRTPARNLPRGRLTDAEEDLLRAVVIFASAGLDAGLKQLIRESLPAVAALDSNSNEEFRVFVRQHLGEAEFGVNTGRLTDVLLTNRTSPRDALLDRYVESLTGESLQSAQQVGSVCTALGITDPALRQRIRQGSGLDLMFRARNEMTHELDLLRDLEPGPGVRPKRTRTINQSVGCSGWLYTLPMRGEANTALRADRVLYSGGECSVFTRRETDPGLPGRGSISVHEPAR